MKIEENYSLEKYNTFHIPACAQWFMEYENEEELQRILRDEYFRECPKQHIGAGSNLLFLNNYKGIILHSAIKGIEIASEDEQSVSLRVGAAVNWDELVAYSVSNGWGGIENLSFIPGETGAAAIQNIGAYGVEIKDVIVQVEAYQRSTGVKRLFYKEECQYKYRSSIFKTEYEDQYIVTYVTIRLDKNPRLSLSYGNLKEELTRYPEITPQTVRQAVMAIRKRKLPDPQELGNAGSFFMNPVIPQKQFEVLKQKYPSLPSFPAGEGCVKIPAGWLIEQCGLKGQRFGPVGVYEKQALVLVNLGGATGSEIALVAEGIRMKVAEQFGIDIVPEVKYIA